MNVLKSILLFTLGAGIGSAATWYFMKRKYEKEEIYEVIEFNPKDKEDKTLENTKEKPNIMDYYKKRSEDISREQLYSQVEEMKEDGYTNVEIANELEIGESAVRSIINIKEPYSITPEEFGEMEEYDKETFWLFADDVLTDHDQNILSKEDVINSVGENYISFIGEYADECAYIRNDQKKTDYEILTDHRKYHEALRGV